MKQGRPTPRRDPAYRRFLAMGMRQSINRRDAARLLQQIRSIDVRHVLVVKMTGDGMLATFDGPGRAI